MSTYLERCRELDRADGYMSDAIGKCQRDLRRQPEGRSRIDLYLQESHTYQAFRRRESLAARYDAARAQRCFLVWNDPSDWKRKVLPMPVGVDWESGVVQQREDGVFGDLRDVRHCLKERAPGGESVPVRPPGPA